MSINIFYTVNNVYVMKTLKLYILFFFAISITTYSLCPPYYFCQDEKVFLDEKGFTYSYFYEGQEVEKVFSLLSFNTIFTETVDNNTYYYGISPLGRKILTQNDKKYNCQIAVFEDKIKFGFPLA